VVASHDGQPLIPGKRKSRELKRCHPCASINVVTIGRRLWRAARKLRRARSQPRRRLRIARGRHPRLSERRLHHLQHRVQALPGLIDHVDRRVTRPVHDHDGPFEN
jgi:hypothetical protein